MSSSSWFWERQAPRLLPYIEMVARLLVSGDTGLAPERGGEVGPELRPGARTSLVSGVQGIGGQLDVDVEGSIWRETRGRCEITVTLTGQRWCDGESMPGRVLVSVLVASSALEAEAARFIAFVHGEVTHSFLRVDTEGGAPCGC